MPIRRSEAALQALLSALTSAAPSGTAVARNPTVPLDVPPAGLIILRDGDPGEPEVLLSPLTYLFDHAAEVEVFAAGDDRDNGFDALARAVSAVTEADRTLGGLCDWIEAKAPVPVDLGEVGTVGIKAATIIIVLSYATTSSVG